MMFHASRGLGDDNSVTAQAAAQLPDSFLQAQPQLNADTVSADCQWCVANPYLSILNPKCWSLNDQVCVSTSVPKQYVLNSVPPMPPDQTTIDTQTPEQTVNDILTGAHTNAVNAAVNAAAVQQQDAAYSSPAPMSGVCTPGSSQYSAIMCFLKSNSGAIFGLGLLAFGIAFAAGPSKGHR